MTQLPLRLNGFVGSGWLEGCGGFKATTGPLDTTDARLNRLPLCRITTSFFSITTLFCILYFGARDVSYFSVAPLILHKFNGGRFQSTR